MYKVFDASLRRHIRIRLIEGYDDAAIIEELIEQGIPLKIAKTNLKTGKSVFLKEIAACKADAAKKARQQSQEPAVVFVGSEGGGEAYRSDDRLSFQLRCFGGVYPDEGEAWPLDW